MRPPLLRSLLWAMTVSVLPCVFVALTAFGEGQAGIWKDVLNSRLSAAVHLVGLARGPWRRQTTEVNALLLACFHREPGISRCEIHLIKAVLALLTERCFPPLCSC